MRKSDNRPTLRPVTKIELSEKNITLRFVLIGLFLAAAITAIVFGLVSILNTEPGWSEVEVTTSDRHHGEEFNFQYYFGASGISATSENKQLSLLYSEAMKNAYFIFSAKEYTDQVNNLCYVNEHINEDITIDGTLYNALSKVKQYESRYLYLAPVYAEYDRIFICENSAEAAQYDPAQNAELAAYMGQVASFAANPEHIDIVLLGDNRIRLSVSDEYLAFIAENEIDYLLDFAWTRNAFIVDYVAELLLEKGYRKGYISSYDGFTRNLSDFGQTFSFNIFDRVGGEVHIPAVMDYSRPVSIVFLRNYPLSERDRWHYFSFEEKGRIATAFVAPEDGMCKSAVNNLVSYSYTAGCADVLLMAAPVFVADEFAADVLGGMAQSGVYSIYGSEQVICYNDPDLAISLNPDTAIQYSLSHIG